MPSTLPDRSQGVIAGRIMDDKGGRDQAGERIAKVIARAGLASRREAEAWIAAGRVAVNGTIISSPACNVSPRDRVTVDGEALPARERTRLFLYHKPRGLLTAHTDPQGRPTIFQQLPAHLPRLISVGRLDFNTEGLILLTNDGVLARILELPATGWLRRYRVRAHGSVTQAQLDALGTGVIIEGVHYGPIEATLDRVQGSNLWLTFAIREGKNREVRNVLGHLGLTVARLIRVSFGPFQLGELAEGAVEEVRTRVLREQLGERLVAHSGADFSAPRAASSPPREKREEGRRNVQQEPIRFAGHPSTRDKPTNKKTKRQNSTSHAWRAHEQQRPAKKLKRKFHGLRADERPRERSSEQPRAGLLTDRKGRHVLVERFGRNEPTEQPETGAPTRNRHGRRFAPDRSGTGRRRPRGH
jgi:23S rRNA pseudouridine2605 synthase